MFHANKKNKNKRKQKKKQKNKGPKRGARDKTKQNPIYFKQGDNTTAL